MEGGWQGLFESAPAGRRPEETERQAEQKLNSQVANCQINRGFFWPGCANCAQSVQITNTTYRPSAALFALPVQYNGRALEAEVFAQTVFQIAAV